MKKYYIFILAFFAIKANAGSLNLSTFLFLGLKKMLKSTQWLAATGNYGRLTPAHKVAALGHCVDLNIFFQPRTKKARLNVPQKGKFWRSRTQLLSSFQRFCFKLKTYVLSLFFTFPSWGTKKGYNFFILGRDKDIFSKSGETMHSSKMRGKVKIFTWPAAGVKPLHKPKCLPKSIIIFLMAPKNAR